MDGMVVVMLYTTTAIESRILKRTGTLVCAAVPLLLNEACGVILVTVLRVEPFGGLTIATAAMSFTTGVVPLGSSAPMSGGGTRVSPSISLPTATLAPMS